VASLIKGLAGHEPNGMLLYLADHGEAVFDASKPDVLGRNEAAPTSPMYTVPFIVWNSPQWQAQQPRDFTATLSRPYSSAHFIHTWADLAGLRFDEYDAHKSLVSSDFQPMPLLIGNPAQPKSLIDFSLIKPKTSAGSLAQRESTQAAEL
jgi:heptose-I-phosphate ethanolaminephosphotransferase